MIADAGGVPTAAGGRIRTGLVFRIAGGLATPDELAEIERLGLRQIIDLRGEGEDRSLVEGWAGSQGIGYRNEPITSATPEQLAAAIRGADSVERATAWTGATYRRIIDEHATAITATIGSLAGELPAGFGCAAGKDRTGVVNALLLVLLGVSEEDVALHYVESAPPIERLRPMVRAHFGLGEEEGSPAGLDVIVGARRETMIEMLEGVEQRYGGVPAYLEGHGLSADAVPVLRERLVTGE